MEKVQILSTVEEAAFSLKRVKDILQVTLEMFDREIPKKVHNPNDSKTLSDYICFGTRANLLYSLIDTVFFDIHNMCNTLTALVTDGMKE